MINIFQTYKQKLHYGLHLSNSDTHTLLAFAGPIFLAIVPLVLMSCFIQWSFSWEAFRFLIALFTIGLLPFLIEEKEK